MTERNEFPAEYERARKMKRFSGNFCSSILLLPAQAEPSCPKNRRPQSPVTSVGASADFSAPLEMLKLKALKKKVDEGTDGLHMHLKRDKLDVSEIMVLKNKPVNNSRQCVVELAKEEYQFIPSYLAGITKTEQFNKFLHFQKEFIAKHEPLQNDFTGSKVSEQHERKLAKELQKICGCHPLHFKQLQVVEEVFEDIYNSSLIFGDILKEIEAVKAQVKGMEKKPSKAPGIQALGKDVQVLMKKASTALEKTKELKNELEMALWISQTPEDKTETCSRHETKRIAQKPFSVSEQLESMRCKVLDKWEEMNILETEKKETMVYAGMVDIMENNLKEIEEVEGNITEILDKLRITQENQR
ncbi:uncharacterized protein C6orf118 homolog [Gymnogyps californianus]|uniref:uncharacterized protein C6orf118 homolog n=1 Tax=Gymnogyps californianus TaxID=33616 RepID=UPI0021CA0E2D|nr:uncharacterized protein C6orf118 homolog [Gymnogyps californianus]